MRILGIVPILLLTASCNPRGGKVCPAPQASTEASRSSQVFEQGGRLMAILPDGRRISPAGTLTKRCSDTGPDHCIGTNPIGAALDPGGRFLAVAHAGARDSSLQNKNQQSLRIVDTASMEVLQIVEEPHFFYGMAWSPAGDRLYVSGSVSNKIHVYAVAPTGGVTRLPSLKVEGNPYGVELTPDGSRLLVTSSHLRQVWIFNTADGSLWKRIPVGDLPYGIATDGKTAWVSNLGSNNVSVINLHTGREVKRIPVGKNPEQVVLHKGLVYVVNSDDDSISIIDPATQTVVGTKLLRGAGELPGMSPNFMAFSPDGSRLYVSIAADNAVDILDASTWEKVGRIPTAQYPLSVQVDSAGSLYILNFKGLTTRTKANYAIGPVEADDEQRSRQYGILQKVAAPDASTLAAETALTLENTTRPRGFFPPPGKDCLRVESPIPLQPDQPSPIKHVIWIVKENKTYDVLLGDMAEDEWHHRDYAVFGDDVTIYTAPQRYRGEKFNVTPNTHALARKYVNHVNFYAQADKSVQGHTWLVGGYVNDYVEKTWDLDAGQMLIPEVEPAARMSTSDIFDWMVQHRKTVRVYGEYAGSADNLFGGAFPLVVHDYVPGVSAYPDTERIKVFLRDWKAGMPADFTYIWVPNDHTLGYSQGQPHPAWMVADNDRAVGQIIEAVSQSRYWKDTAIFVFQDDPQGSADHIDHRRSVLLTVSPYAKQGVNATTHANFLSIHRTTFAFLGVPPLNRLMADTPPLWEDFEMHGPGFDLAKSRYTTAPLDPKFEKASEWIVGTEDPALQTFSKTMRFDTHDRNNNMGPLIWWAMRGPGPIPEMGADEEDDDE